MASKYKDTIKTVIFSYSKYLPFKQWLLFYQLQLFFSFSDPQSFFDSARKYNETMWCAVYNCLEN